MRVFPGRILDFQRPGAWLPLPSFLPWEALLDPSPSRPPLAKKLMRGAEFQKGRPVVMGRVRPGCVRVWKLGTRAGRVKQKRWARIIFPSLHLPPIPLSFFKLTTLFLLGFFFSLPLIYCSTKFRFLCEFLVFEANVQFWNYLASETDKVKVTKGKSQTFKEVFKTHNKLCTRCSLKYKWSSISGFVFLPNFLFSL